MSRPRLRPIARAVCAIAAGAVIIAAPAGAHAGDKDATWGGTGTVSRARAAYERGVRAHSAGDHAAAARAFAEADALVPEAASLEAALEAAMRADDAVLGAELLERGASRPADEGLRRTMGAARARFAGRTGSIRVDCGEATSCLVAVDGIASDASRLVHVKVGPHAVVVQRGGERIEELVEIAADRITLVPARRDRAVAGRLDLDNVRIEGDLVKPPPAEPRRGGLSPAWFVVAVGATAVAGGFTLFSGLDAVGEHDRFVDAGCAKGAVGPRGPDCDARASAGEDAQLRTNVALGVTAALAVATTAIGVFAVRWHGGTARATVGATGSAAAVGLELHTP